MILGVSHLLFNTDIDLLQLQNTMLSEGVSNLEVVISKISKSTDYRLKVKSAQSLLHNTAVIDFLDQNFVNTIDNISQTGTQYGIEVLVLGSPKQRKIFDRYRLLANFEQIDGMIRSRGQILCLEPNAKVYGGQYFYTIPEIVDFIREGNYTNIKTMVDTHNLELENENIVRIFEEYFGYIDHVHISEVGLGEFRPTPAHRDLSKLIKLLKYDKIITYEALNLKDPIKSIQTFANLYGN